MAKIKLEVLSSPGCHNCRLFLEFWETIKDKYPDAEFHHYDMITDEGQAMIQKYMIFASPGIIVNDELFATGGFNKDEFMKKMNELSGK